MKSRQRYSWIDILYAMGIVLVVIGHSHPSDWTVYTGTFFEEIIKFIYSFHMPLFFFIAGFLFMNSDVINKGGYVQWIKKKSIRLLTPYLMLSLVAFIPKYYLEYHRFVSVKALIEAICIPRIGVWGHFWFIPVLLLCYVIFGVWRTQVTEKNILYMLFAVSLASLIGYFLPLSTQWFGISDLKTFCIYFCIGMWMKCFEKYKVKKTNVIRWFMSSGMLIVSFVLNYYMKNKITIFIISILMIFVCYELARIFNELRIASWISRYNFTIYIYSWPFQAIVMSICGKVGMPWYWTSVGMFLIGFIGPISIIIIYKKVQFLHNHFWNLVLGMK